MTLQELYANIGGDYESALRIMQMDRLIANFILKYLDDASCARLCSAWDAGDHSGVFEGAHAMKGVCANLGLNALSAQAGELAEEFRPGRGREMDDAAVRARVEELRAQDERVREGIRAYAEAQ